MGDGGAIKMVEKFDQHSEAAARPEAASKSGRNKNRSVLWLPLGIFLAALVMVGSILLLRGTKKYAIWKTAVRLEWQRAGFLRLVSSAEVTLSADEGFLLNVAHYKEHANGLVQDVYFPFFLIKMDDRWLPVEFGRYGVYPYEEHHNYIGNPFITRIGDYTVICVDDHHSGEGLTIPVSDSLGTQPLLLFGSELHKSAESATLYFPYLNPDGSFDPAIDLIKDLPEQHFCLFVIKNMPEDYTLQLGGLLLTADEINAQLDAYPMPTISWKDADQPAGQSGAGSAMDD